MIPLRIIDALDAVTIPVTCPVSWEAMHGGPRTRFCGTCKQNVHDVSELSREEAVQLLTSGDNLPCLRIYQRQDGRVMTADCLNRRERAWKWLHNRSAWAAGFFAVIFFVSYESTKSTMGVPCRAYSDEPESVVEKGAQSIVEGVTAEAGKPTGFALVVDEAAQSIVEGITSEVATGR